MQAEYFKTGKTLLIDKPLNWTSFDVVNKIRFSLKRKLGVKKIKVGHAGTLDPLATGLLIICTGKHTKTIESLQGLDKTYTGTITLGATTPSFDLETEPKNHQSIEGIKEENIESVVNSFVGEQEQLPPIFSAKKVDGKVAYNEARKGRSITLKPRLINIHSFLITGLELPKVHFEVSVSKGTYIRSLANDVGQKLGVGGYLSALRRTQVGEFSIDDAHSIDEILTLIEDAIE